MDAEKEHTTIKPINKTKMREKIIRAFAGTMVLISVTLALTVHIYWLGLAGFVGFNLLQSSVSGFCPLQKILTKLGVDDTDGGCRTC